jgi:uncharacterized protein YdaU (DUF1376 family)
MKGKKSFQLYTDYLHLIQELTYDERGIVFTWVLEYCNDMNPEPPDDRLLRVIVNEIKSDLKRDLVKYKDKCTINAKNGSLGGRPKNPKEPKKTERLFPKPKKADIDIDIDIDIKKEKSPTIQEVEEYFISNGFSKQAAKKAHSYYEAGGWKDSTGKKVRNWKQKMQGVWFKDENKIIEQTKKIYY